MLTKVKAYTSVAGAPTLLAPVGGNEFTDYLQVRDITGLAPVKATINTAPFSFIAGASFVGSEIPTRNIVLTLHPNPDWMTWTVESLRKLVYLYFQPGSLVQLVFEDSVRAPVTIFGYVESCEPNPFAKDIEIPISIICPDPYFTSLNPVVVTGRTVNSYSPTPIIYNGDVEVGVQLEVDFHTGETPTTSIQVQTQDPSLGTFVVSNAVVNSEEHFVMSSVDTNKYVDDIRDINGLVVGRMSDLNTGYVWPRMRPGSNGFSVITDAGSHDWTLTYYEKFGGL